MESRKNLNFMVHTPPEMQKHPVDKNY